MRHATHRMPAPRRPIAAAARSAADPRRAMPRIKEETALLNALFATTMAVLAVPPLYLIKSALGIDLMPGPSPLHDLLYWMLR